jgi:hypothetical protein
MNNINLGLKGLVTVEAINGGKTVHGPVKVKNLWLDQGLDNAAFHPLCELFEVAVKGTGNDITKEDLTGTANTYSIPNNSAVMTRTAGTRDFTVDDVGKLVRFTNGKEFHISGFTSTTVVSISPPASPAITNLKLTLYSVQQVGLETEIGRTQVYSVIAGDNSTATAANVRTFKRVFIFDGEDIIKEVVAASNTFAQGGVFVTKAAGPRDFTPGDVGKTLTFVESGEAGTITSFVAPSQVTLDTDRVVPEGTIILTGDSGLKEVLTGTYSRATTTVTRVTGVRDFNAGDVGKYIHFDTDNVEAKITAFTDATHVTVDTSGTLAAQTTALYGFTDYNEIGFSHTDEFGNNLNIRVLLSAPVRAYISTPLRASDQVKVTYQCTLTVTPSAATALNLSTLISDPGNSMSGNKNGSYAIETFATSMVAADGSTDIGLVDLEPYYDGSTGLSLDSAALDPFSGKIRENGLATVPLIGASYNAGSFTRVFAGTFGLNDAINDNWRSLMIIDPDSRLAAFTFLYNVVQHKDGDHTFTIAFRKTWGRDLS